MCLLLKSAHNKTWETSESSSRATARRLRAGDCSMRQAHLAAQRPLAPCWTPLRRLCRLNCQALSHTPARQARVRTPTLVNAVSLWSTTTADLESGAHPHSTATNHPTHHPRTPPIRPAKGSVRISLPQHNRIGSNPLPAEAATHTVTMAGNPPVRPIYRFMATGLGASMWFFVRRSLSREQLELGS